MGHLTSFDDISLCLSSLFSTDMSLDELSLHWMQAVADAAAAGSAAGEAKAE